ncbi:MAG TPA: protein kinase [Pyrinomonadaceae bacterium]|nr:protein kinase [Pyrinomonadaceae bacterium]
MSPEQWEQVKNIFEQAMAIAPKDRQKFVNENCSDNESVKLEVEELLNSYQNSESFLEVPAISKKKNEFKSGQSFGQYEIIKSIGAGGMGDVFLAKDTKLKRNVALKFLPAEFTANKERLQRFEQEARSASSLNHPNILTIHEIDEHEGISFIATEFIDGETLRSQIKQKDLSFQKILDIVTQTVSALAAAHEAGIVHRDIKPENIMIRRDGIVKILDFGLAKPLAHRDSDREKMRSGEEEATLIASSPRHPVIPSPSLTTPGMIMGTVAYMSPEQTRGKAIDTRTDIWSLGVVLYEMVAGRVPFDGETSSDIIAAILKTNPDPLPVETPAELQRIIGKTLRHDKEERYQTAKDLLVDLKNLKQDLEFNEKLERKSNAFSEQQKAALTTNEQAHTTLQINYRKLPFILIAVALIVVISAISYLFWQRKIQPNQPDEPVKIDSLAVLPFENSASNTEYLSDGITESLINSLSNLPNLRVISRNTVFSFKGKNETPKEIAKNLNVKTILTGKVTQQGDSIIIQSELVNVENDSQIWSKRFNVKMSDLMGVQEQIAEQITVTLQLKLNSNQKAKIAKHYTENADAYREYLKGRFYSLQYSAEGHKKALEHLNKAVEIDPTYALAYAGIADSYTTASDTILSPREALTKAKAASQKAINLDDQLAEAWAAHGHARLHEWDKAAIDDLNRAIELSPNSLTTQLWLGEYYMIWDIEKSVKVLENASEIDPLSGIPPAFISFDYYMLRKPDKALEYGKKAIDLAPYYFTENAYMARYYAYTNDYKSALDQLNKIPPEARDSQALSTRGFIFALQGNRQEAEKVIIELQKMSTNQYVSPFEFAIVYNALKDRDKTFLYLQKAFVDRSENLSFIRYMPDFDAIRDDSRYIELINKIGFSS